MKEMSIAGAELLKRFHELAPEDRAEFRDTLIREAIDGGELDEIELIAIEAGRRMAMMLDAEENETQAR